MCLSCFICFFFFSSRRRHTRSLCDWSSDVCSSDLIQFDPAIVQNPEEEQCEWIELDQLVSQRPGIERLVSFQEFLQSTRFKPERARQIGRASCRERV